MAASSSKASNHTGINLTNLPSSGLLTSGASFGPPPALYVAKKRDTVSPVEVTTDQSSLLIRCLQSKKKMAGGGLQTQKPHLNTGGRGGPVQDEKKRKAQGAPEDAERTEADLDQSHKKTREIQRVVYSEETLLQMRVARLKVILGEKGLAVSGKKADLVQRILDNQW